MTDTLPGGTQSGLTRQDSAFRRASLGFKQLETSCEWIDFDVALLAVAGEIDSLSSDELLDYVLSKVLLCRVLVLDLTGVQFFSCDGYRMLKTLERRCLSADVELRVQPSPCVTQLLRICERADDQAVTPRALDDNAQDRYS